MATKKKIEERKARRSKKIRELNKFPITKVYYEGKRLIG